MRMRLLSGLAAILMVAGPVAFLRAAATMKGAGNVPLSKQLRYSCAPDGLAEPCTLHPVPCLNLERCTLHPEP